MSERSDLLEAVADTIKTYRTGEIEVPTPDHVDRWVSQFTPEAQIPFLREFAHVIDKSFVGHAEIVEFLTGLVTNVKLAGTSPVEYWSKVNFLRVQQNGVSQREMLKLFAECLRQQLGLDMSKCGDPSGDYVYLDDIVFTGSRVQADLESWIMNDAPAKAKVHVLVAVLHTSASDYLQRTRLPAAVAKSKKDITVKFWRILDVENQKANRNVSEVLWPVALPNDYGIPEYASAQKFPFTPRTPGGKSVFFATEEGRQVLERELLIAGMKIRSHHAEPKQYLKPLGFGGFGVGFGSTLVTYRNCPNNAPLAIWWGEGASSGALQWYPLLPRKTYSSLENVFQKLFT